MAMRRPTWILRLEGLPQDVVAAFDHDMRSQIQDIQDGRAVYHPTANNCTVASLRALTHLGFEVAAAHGRTVRARRRPPVLLRRVRRPQRPAPRLPVPRFSPARGRTPPRPWLRCPREHASEPPDRHRRQARSRSGAPGRGQQPVCALHRRHDPRALHRGRRTDRRVPGLRPRASGHATARSGRDLRLRLLRDR